MNPTHDWHVADGMELMIRRDESDSVGVMLGHENIDDVRSTLITTSRLLEMIDTVQPGAVRAYLEQQASDERQRGDDFVAMVSRVRALHSPEEYGGGGPESDDGVMCTHCEVDDGSHHADFPCETIRALEGDV